MVSAETTNVTPIKSKSKGAKGASVSEQETKSPVVIAKFDSRMRVPIEYREVELDEPYTGWKITIRTNPRLSTMDAISSGDINNVRRVLPGLILGWNFPDDESDDEEATRPLPKDVPEGIGILNIQELVATMKAYTKAMNEATAPPKDSTDDSEST